MKLKKILAVLVLTLIISISASQGVFAQISWSYGTITVPKSSSKYVLSTSLTQNYKYAMNYITSFSSNYGAAAHSEYYSYYNGSLQSILGSDIKTTSTGGALWKPTGVSANPSNWTIIATSKCVGTETSSSYCGLKGNTYALRIQNENILSSITVGGQLTMDN